MVSAKKICYVAVLTALTAVFSSLSVPTPAGGHIYLTDVVVCFAAFVLDPLLAAVAGGLGSFLGDWIFYPQAMFVSLATHGLQAVAISLISGGVKRCAFGKEEKGARTFPAIWRIVLAAIVGTAVMGAGYALGNAYVYGGKSWAVAIAKLPGEFLQGGFGAVVAAALIFEPQLKRLFFYDARKKEKEKEGEAEKRDFADSRRENGEK